MPTAPDTLWLEDVSRPVDSGRSLAIKRNPLKFPALVVLAVFVLLSLDNWRAGRGDLALPLLLTGVALCTPALLFGFSIRMDSRGIFYKTLLERCSMRWDEVEMIEVEEPYRPGERIGAKSALVFVGENKRLSIPGPNYWRGGDGAEMLRLPESKLEERRVETRETPTAWFKRSRNTKVR